MEAEKITQHMGGYGRWQIIITIFHATAWAAIALEFTSIYFMVDTPPYHCKVPDNSTFNDTIPATWKDGELVDFERCSEYVNKSVSNETQPCSNGYWFDPTAGYESTMTMDYELVCGKEVYIEISMMIRTITCGVLVLVVNALSDRYGRKTVYMAGALTKPVFLLIKAFMPNFYLAEVFNTLAGVSTLCYMSTSFILVMEMTAAKKRTGLATSMEMFWAVGLIAAVPVAYLVRNWRTLQLIIAVPLFGLYLAFFTPESITWLYSKGRYSQIEKIVRQAAKCNQLPVPTEAIRLLRDAETKKWTELVPLDEKGNNNKEHSISVKNDAATKKEKSPTVLDLIRTPRVRMYTLIQIFIWCTNTFVYHALSLTMTYMPGNRYTNLLYYAIAELVAALLHAILLIKFGRRIPLFCFHIVAGVGLSLTVVEAFKDSLSINWLPMVVVFNVIGKLGITASFMTIYLYTSELYPTQIRQLALGFVSAFSTLADIVAPYSRVMERTQPGLLRVFSGVLCLVAAFLGLLLPETHNRPLPETIDQVEKMSRTVEREEKNGTAVNA